MIVTIVIALLASLALPKLRDILVKAHVKSIVADGKILYAGFQQFYAENYSFPNATSNPYFDLTTFEPLLTMGFYQGNMFERLNNNQADAFNSPDDQGPNQEFWVLLSVRLDPSYQIVIASSDNAPMGGGNWLEGVYTFQDGQQVGGPGMIPGG